MFIRQPKRKGCPTSTETWVMALTVEPCERIDEYTLHIPVIPTTPALRQYKLAPRCPNIPKIKTHYMHHTQPPPSPQKAMPQ